MSGILACYHIDNKPVDSLLLRNLLQEMAWRGRDQQGLWHAQYIALGSVQLWSTPEDWGVEQPICHENGCHIVLDGRLDNRSELIRALSIPVHEAVQMCDAALMLTAYQAWGKECVNHFIGPFSFALWDAGKQHLVCARDGSCLRTFFYQWTGKHFIGSSTLKQLQNLPHNKTTLNDDYIWDYLCSAFSSSMDPEATPFTTIRRLPPGHLLSLTPNGLSIERYWKPWELPLLNYKRDEEYGEHLCALLFDVIQAQCRAVGPVGATLSGGLDSSSIVCIARELEKAGKLPSNTLHTYTAIWDRTARGNTDYDELELAKSVVEKYKGPAHYIDIKAAINVIHNASPPLSVIQDEPYLHLNKLWGMITQTVHQEDSRVLLTGMGGDERFTGNYFFALDLLRQGHMGEFGITLREFTQWMPFGQFLINPILVGILPRYLGNWLQTTALPAGISLGLPTRYYWRVPSWLPNQEKLKQRGRERHKFIREKFSTFAAQAEFDGVFSAVRDNTMLYFDQYMGLPLNLDFRHPFCDKRIIEFALCTPHTQKLRGGSTKYVLRKATNHVLPESILQRRTKTVYDFVFYDTLHRYWHQLQEMMQTSRAAALGYVDGQAFLNVFNVLCRGGDLANQASASLTLGLEFWLRSLEPDYQKVQMDARDF